MISLSLELATYFNLQSNDLPTEPLRCNEDLDNELSTVKPVLNDHSQKDKKLVFKTNYPLMQVKSIAESSKGSILQYLRHSLSYHLSLRPLFCLFLSGRFTQVLL